MSLDEPGAEVFTDVNSTLVTISHTYLLMVI